MERPTPPKPNGLIGARHRQMLLVSCGLLVAHTQKQSLSIAFVAMANPISDIYPTITYTPFQKGVLVSAIFYGYLVGSIPMGLLTRKFGPTKIFAISGGIIFGMLTASLPLVAIFFGYEWMLAMRFIQGIIFAGIMPCSHQMISKWIASHERENFSWTFSGITLSAGTASLMGILAASPGGWPSIFYVSGLIGIFWGIICLYVGADSPAVHKTISKRERAYIEFYCEKNHSDNKSLSTLPWAAILKSMPFWAAALAQSADRWGTNFVNNFFPSFLHGVYGFNIETNGILSALPGLASFICAFLFSYLGGVIRIRTSLNFSRKFWNVINLVLPAILLVILVIMEPGADGSVAIMVLCHALMVGASNGCMINTIDLSPHWASVLISLTFIPSNIAAILSTTYAGWVVKDEHDIGDWQIVFLTQAAVFLVGGSIFQLFGSTQIQPWNFATSRTKETNRPGIKAPIS